MRRAPGRPRRPRRRRAGARRRPSPSTSAGRTSDAHPSGAEHVADVAVRHRGQDRPARGEVLVGLVRDQAGPLAGRQVVHGQEQQVGASASARRTRDAPSSPGVRTNGCRAATARSACVSSPARCSSTRPARLGSAAITRAIACHEDDVRAREDVEARRSCRRAGAGAGACGAGAGRGRCAAIPCARSGTRRRGAGRRAPAKSAGSKPIGMPRSSTREASSGIAARTRSAASGAAMTIADAVASARRIRPQVERAVHGAERQAHLVERPQILEIGDPRAPERRGHARAGERGLVRQAGRVDHVRVTAHLAGERVRSRPPTSAPTAAGAPRARSSRVEPPDGSARTRWTSVSGGTRASRSSSRGSQRSRLRGRAGDHHRSIAVGRQVANRPQGAVHARPRRSAGNGVRA